MTAAEHAVSTVRVPAADRSRERGRERDAYRERDYGRERRGSGYVR